MDLADAKMRKEPLSLSMPTGRNLEAMEDGRIISKYA